MSSGNLSALFPGRGSKAASAPVRRFAPKAGGSSASLSATPQDTGQSKAVDGPVAVPIARSAPATITAEEEGQYLDVLANNVSDMIPTGIMMSPARDTIHAGSAESTVRVTARQSKFGSKDHNKPQSSQDAGSSNSVSKPTIVTPSVTFGDVTVHELIFPAHVPPAHAPVSKAPAQRLAKKRSESTESTKQRKKQQNTDYDIEQFLNDNKKRSPQTSREAKPKRTKHGHRVEPAYSVLPSSFGAGTPYTEHTVYLKKTESGVGLKLKNMEGKAVIKGVAASLTDHGVQKNDVIMAANELDARYASFDAIIDKFRWIPRVGDWCGLHSVEQSALAAQLRVRGNSVDGESASTPQYMHMTTPEQDIVASYPVKLSRVEDVVCLKLARPQGLKSSNKDGVVFI